MPTVDEIISDNMGLVSVVVGLMRKRLPRTVSTDELEAAGKVGLWYAARTWQPERCQFRTHASNHIHWKTIEWMRDQSILTRAMHREQPELGRHYSLDGDVKSWRETEDVRATRPTYYIEQMDSVRHILTGLTRAEALTMLLYHIEGFTLKEIGKIIGYSESRAHQIHESALAKSRARLTNVQHMDKTGGKYGQWRNSKPVSVSAGGD